jgi:uncharacterized membrane protein
LKESQAERNAVNLLGIISLSALLGVGIVFAVYSHWNFIIEHVWKIIILFCLPMLLHVFVYSLLYVSTGGTSPDLPRSLKDKYIIFIAICYSVAAYAISAIGMYEIYKIAFSPGMSQVTSVVIVGSVTLAIGAVLFYFRLRWRFAYGFTETLVGVAVASQRFYSDAMIAKSFSTGPLLLTILTAGIYLVVRGADNMHQGLTKEPLDPLGKKVREWLRSIGQGASAQDVLTGYLVRSYTRLADQINGIEREDLTNKK